MWQGLRLAAEVAMRLAAMNISYPRLPSKEKIANI